MPKKFAVKATKSFLKSLEKLSRAEAVETAKKLKMLEYSPLPAGKSIIKKLKGYKPPTYRMRVGKRRVIYRISGAEVVLLKLVDRKELERELKKLLG